MEVCPDFVLEGLRERKKWALRAELIDNQTYKRAMKVSDFNRGRSVSDLKLKTWAYSKTLRTDSVYEDDRYNPTKYSHPHRYDNVNFPDQEYTDFFGGTVGEKDKAEREKYRLDFQGHTSNAIKEYQSEKRIAKLRDVASEVASQNSKE